MIWAIKDNERIKASPKSNALCPICNTEVISKCGVVKEWHWSHKSIQDCDNWAEPESEWHLKWKSYFPKEQQEVILENHRADIKTQQNLIIELQNSPISSDDICDREKFYKNMIWLLNGNTLGKNLEIREKSCYFTFVWKSPPQSWFSSDKIIYVDIENQLKDVKEYISDCHERVILMFEKLKELLNQDPNAYFMENKYLSSRDLCKEFEESKRNEILKTYGEWSELSKEILLYKRKRDMFNSRTIFLIKKLYKQVPCSGWGYLISKEDFLRNIGGVEYEEKE
mgnify:CR=1 FL=1